MSGKSMLLSVILFIIPADNVDKLYNLSQFNVKGTDIFHKFSDFGTISLPQIISGIIGIFPPLGIDKP